MACKYCDWWCKEHDHEDLINTRTKLSKKGEWYPGITATINELGYLTIEAVADTYEPGYLDHVIEINFCPMCGREFKR